MRETRPAHGELTDEQRRRANARSMANTYRTRGLLVAEPCFDCGTAPASMHHPDYDRPVDVVWLCSSCHKARHRDGRAASRRGIRTPAYTRGAYRTR